VSIERLLCVSIAAILKEYDPGTIEKFKFQFDKLFFKQFVILTRP